MATILSKHVFSLVACLLSCIAIPIVLGSVQNTKRKLLEVTIFVKEEEKLCLYKNFGSTPAVRPMMLQAAKRGASSPPDYTHSTTQIPTVQRFLPFVCLGAT